MISGSKLNTQNKKTGPCKGLSKKKEQVIMVLRIASESWDDKRSGEVVIHGASSIWLGKVGPGQYKLITPWRYSRQQMMSLPSVMRLVSSGELPHIRFAQKCYIVMRK